MVVTGDEADVVGAAQLILTQCLHEAHRHQVVGDEHRVRPPPQQGDAALVTRLDAEVAGDDQLRLEYLSGSADVQVGDKLVTSGIDGIYPKGFVIGWIQKAERVGGAYGTIVVRPAVDFASLEHVLVVLTPPAAAADDAAATPAGGTR